ncbi:unnamed protein product [Penicillium pancosmium]
MSTELFATKEDWPTPDFLSFFDIFLDFQQLHHLESVLDHAVLHFEKADSPGQMDMTFAEYMINYFTFRSWTMYRVFQIVLKADDQYHLAHLAEFQTRTGALPENIDITYLKYLIATVLFDKGWLDLGVQDAGDSLAYLVMLCLGDVNIPSCEAFQIVLDTAAELSDACLVISSWLQRHGYPDEAKHVLRGRMRACVALLSDDASKNDEDTFKALFHTFLMEPSSEEDLGAALYCVKESQERAIKAYHEEECDTWDSENIDSTDGHEKWHVQFMRDELTRCSICIQCISIIQGWYYCRSCPLKTCCRQCASKHRPVANDSGTSKCPGICDDDHDFFYTGGHIRDTERVPEGMVAFFTSGGESNAIWIEDWKDRLVKKWETADFTFDGGLSAWCMSILPEPQKARWARMFKI